MDISDLKVGGKNDTHSFGQFVLQNYEVGSTMTISPGGSGTVCVGGSGSSASSCAANGGVWEDRGQEGITVKLKQIFAERVSDTKQNRFVWETNRSGG